MSLICLHCQHENREGAKFCHSCGAPLGVTTTLQTLGTLLDERYRLLDVLGRGGMGAVYLGERVGLGRVAIKEMHDQFSNPDERQQSLALFQAEARMLFNLHHANLPRVHDYFQDAGRHYLVMDYVEGKTLKQLMEQASGFLAADDVRGWAAQVCDVLTYLHAQNPPIIFRDLNPSNIMLEPSGRIKLIDFGIARFFSPTKSKDTLRMGTAGYAPPEQYGEGQTDARSDLYALGATLHHVLTRRDPGEQPFFFPDARTLNPNVSIAMSDALKKAVEFQPATRFQTAAEMKDALEGKIAAALLACPRCGQINPAREVYCQRCARQLSGNRQCPHCGRMVPDQAQYCVECGRQISQTSPVASAPATAMVACSRCGQMNAPAEIYCQRCAQPLGKSKACPNCSRLVPDNAPYCVQCGSKM